MKDLKKIPVVPKKNLISFILVTSLFALWGFANAVTDPMVQAFKKVLELSNSEAAWVQMAFYGGYFCMALPAAIFKYLEENAKEGKNINEYQEIIAKFVSESNTAINRVYGSL